MQKNTSGLLMLGTLLLLILSACTPNTTPSATGIDIRTAYPGLPQAGTIPTPGYAVPYYLTAKLSDLQPPTDAPQPEPGMGSISALLYVPREELILAQSMFYLCRAEGENNDQMPSIQVVGGIESRGDIVGWTDERGVLTVNNIPPGNYFLLSSPPNNVTEAVVSIEDNTPLLITIVADQALPLGIVIIPSN